VDCGVVSLPLPGPMPTLTGGAFRGRPSGRTDEFLVGPENRLAEVAVQTVLEGNGHDHFNPLLFYGPSGCGKSHLAMGIAAGWSARCEQRRRVHCVAADDFAIELHEAIAAQATADFRRKYREAEMLVIENIPRLAGKTAAQEELLHTIDALIANGRRVVGTALTPPSRWSDISPAIRSRFHGGLLVPVQLPGSEVRRLLIERWSGALGLSIEADAAALAAQRLALSAPELLGALMQLRELGLPPGQVITLEQVRRFLARFAGQSAPSLKEIAGATARHFGVTLGQMRSKSRRRAVVLARDTAIYLARELAGCTLPELGRYFGNRDHTTISHGYHKLKQMLLTDADVQQAVSAVQNMLKEC